MESCGGENNMQTWRLRAADLQPSSWSGTPSTATGSYTSPLPPYGPTISYGVSLLLTSEAEALLLPVLGLIDPGPDDFLHQVLRVCAMDTVSVFHRPVRHLLRSQLPAPGV